MPRSTRRLPFAAAALLAVLGACSEPLGPGVTRAGTLVVHDAPIAYSEIPHDHIAGWVQYVVAARVTLVNRSSGVLVIERCAEAAGPVLRMRLVMDDPDRTESAYWSPLGCEPAPPLLLVPGAEFTTDLEFVSLTIPRVPEFSAFGFMTGRMRARAFTSSGALESEAFDVVTPE
jgi:hypothetical protein